MNKRRRFKAKRRRREEPYIWRWPKVQKAIALAKLKGLSDLFNVYDLLRQPLP